MASQNAGGNHDMDIEAPDQQETSLNGGGNHDMDIEAPDQQASTEFLLKKYLLLLATLVATVTYVAGLNLPGGSWLEDSGGQVAGESILRETNYYRYIVFYYCNATSFAASVMVSLLLLLLQEKGDQSWLRAVMVVDLFGLMGAYAAGSSRDAFTTICASVMVFGLFAYVIVAFLLYFLGLMPPLHPNRAKPPAKHEVLMVLAIFAATIAYVAGMNPPGGFWRSTQEGHHTGGDPILQAGGHSARYKAFFFCNTTALVASLLAIVIIVDYKKLNICCNEESLGLHVSIVTALFGLGGAYAAGSCRDRVCTAYVLSLVPAVVAYIFLHKVLTQATMVIAKAIKLPKITRAIIELPCIGGICEHLTKWLKKIRDFFTRSRGRQRDDKLDKAREFIQLLAILAATITYQAGLDPPGGVWPDNGEGHTIGDSILLTTHPGRYKVFFYCNSAAFVASLVIIVMLQSESLVRLHVMEAAMILDLFSLVGAYAAGSCRDTSTSIYVVAIAGAVLIYVVIHIVFSPLDHISMDDEETDKYREVLLLLAILAATLTYQAGLTPPRGFWEMDDDKLGHHAGFSVLQDKSPLRYKAFFYCNAASFMASVALIILLVNPSLYKPGIRCSALFVCMVGGMFGLMAAYAAGSSLHLKASIFILVLVAAVILYTGYAYYRHRPKPQPPVQEQQHQAEEEEEEEEEEADDMAKYLMLLGILAASVTYLTGLKPPGGLWRDDNNGHSAGSPILYDMDRHRHYVFYYCNSTSFMASIIVIALLLGRILRKPSLRSAWPMHAAMLLGLLALLGAYAAGSARDGGTLRNVILLPFPVMAFLGLLFYFKS